MLNRIARHTLPICILFLTVYAALFTVQLHFRYKSAASPDKEICTTRYSEGPSSNRKVYINYKSYKYTVKVSKRYQHKTVYEFPLVTIPEVRVFAGRHIHSACCSGSLCHLTLPSSPHRGPPAIG